MTRIMVLIQKLIQKTDKERLIVLPVDLRSPFWCNSLKKNTKEKVKYCVC